MLMQKSHQCDKNSLQQITNKMNQLLTQVTETIEKKKQVFQLLDNNYDEQPSLIASMEGKLSKFIMIQSVIQETLEKCVQYIQHATFT